MEDDLRPNAPLPLGERRCAATNRAGERCRRAPILGGTVCSMHGGNAPQVKEAAMRTLLAARDRAAAYLFRVLEPHPPCPHCGRSDADRDPVVVRAAQIVLDRTGLGPSAKLTIEEKPRLLIVALPANGRVRLPPAELVEDAVYVEDGEQEEPVPEGNEP